MSRAAVDFMTIAAAQLGLQLEVLHANLKSVHPNADKRLLTTASYGNIALPILSIAEKQGGRAFRMPARQQRGLAAQAEMIHHREHVVGERRPLVPLGSAVAVAVAAEVERPDLSPASDEARPHGRPGQTVEPGRVREQDGVAVATPVVHDEAQPAGVEAVGAEW